MSRDTQQPDPVNAAIKLINERIDAIELQIDDIDAIVQAIVELYVKILTRIEKLEIYG